MVRNEPEQDEPIDEDEEGENNQDEEAAENEGELESKPIQMNIQNDSNDNQEVEDANDDKVENQPVEEPEVVIPKIDENVAP